jgi:hypothetical protein
MLKLNSKNTILYPFYGCTLLTTLFALENASNNDALEAIADYLGFGGGCTGPIRIVTPEF